MALRDHNYVIPANHEEEEEVGAPNIYLQDHTYAQQLPAVQIQAQPEEDREALEDGPAPDEEEEEDEAVEQEEDGAVEQEDGAVEQEDGAVEQEDGAVELVMHAEPRTYRIIPGIRLNSKFYVDNLGFKYYRKKLLVNTINLICELRKNPRGDFMCHGSASISINERDNRLRIVTDHNHDPEAINLDVPFLRNALGERAVDRTVTTPSVRGLYNSEIIKHPQAAISYTFLQTQSRAKRMRQSRRPQLPQNIHELSEMLSDPRNSNYASTFQIPSSAFFNQELIVNGVSVGVIFANISAIEKYRQELATVEMVGIDGTYKTVPQVPGDLRCFLIFQVLYKSVAFPMVYVLLGSETEETYSALFTVIRNILPLNYDRIRFVTDYERALMNAVQRIFPNSELLCCWFHFSQSVVRYCHRKVNGVLNLVKRHEVAARIFRMVLALPHLPAERGNPGCPNFCMEDGFHTIVAYTLQFPDISEVMSRFLRDYVFDYWFVQIGPRRLSVFGQDHRTNNYLESFHSTLLTQIGRHPNIWDFLQRLIIVENQFYVEFQHRTNNLTIRDGTSRSLRENATRIIRESVQQLNRDSDLLMFLRRTGHRNDGYVQEQIGPYP
ncbi:unnamed protein product [Macrosiphum euphorbiae]|uniref:MULE transposase domain-containing protein n=1 Tax=Macrosiphum euphorbiae TaxID=13131 RepID=A0AAV0XUY6_9HEMI|nr:unnamed protein product [Macrosiphum euphorbiae]